MSKKESRPSISTKAKTNTDSKLPLNLLSVKNTDAKITSTNPTLASNKSTKRLSVAAPPNTKGKSVPGIKGPPPTIVISDLT